ncbi:MAG: aspartate aminotransferase family protein [Verrucomicrobia bacterium]|nr:aspartate aminotransferase family protein [Verrucomicrobiota bacterium]NBU07893.1 aspartate aminotransferase family protein [Pseudomonadota bacterium]NDB76014.1 aspartate aminotransferase family protein [Verrucomicrobiota bacterium]NDD38238.1 aspartate aminotransferase family protein [Verrucomicrobiota bacterium]
MEADGSWPIVWARARGVNVWDSEGRKHLDLTAAFGVAAAGHANPRVVRAGQRQMATLLHAMGDVHPHSLKAVLAKELSALTFERWSSEQAKGKRRKTKGPAFTGKTIFCNSGFEAVEAALKTAALATGKRGVIAFEGAYHGLGYGALNVTHRAHFRSPFRAQLREFGHFLPFPDAVGRGVLTAPSASGRLRRAEDSAPYPLRELRTRLEKLLRRGDVGAILVEPVQARGGLQVPPPEFLPHLREMCDAHGALLILDEIYTGFGRTGKWFACEHSGVVPDVICLGKALTGGFPLSACVGRAEVMDAAWPVSTGEAIHTSTFLGHPVGCAMALAQIAELQRLKLVERTARLGAWLGGELAKVHGPKSKVQSRVRGVGLMQGLELVRADGSPATEESLGIIKRLLHRGFIFLPEGEHANVIGFTPPLTITQRDLRRAIAALADELATLP